MSSKPLVYPTPDGCTYASPIGVLPFLAQMPEVKAMIVALTAIGAAIYLSLQRNYAAAVALLAVGAALTRYFGSGGPVPVSLGSTKLTSTAGRPLNAVVTGASSGIGSATVLGLLRRRIHVTLAVRDTDKARAVVASFAASLSAELTEPEVTALVTIEQLDLTSLTSVRACAKALLDAGRPIDILVCNAGAMLSRPGLVKDAAPGRPIDTAFATNVVGHFLLCALLFPRLLADRTRVVTLSSAIHLSAKLGTPSTTYNVTDASKWDAPTAYAQGKICAIWLAKALQYRFDRAYKAQQQQDAGSRGDSSPMDRATAVSVHPGTVWTPFHMPFYRDSPAGIYMIIPALFGPIAYFAFKSPDEGARCSLHCALDRHGALAAPAAGSAAARAPARARVQPGQLHMDGQVCATAAAAADSVAAEGLWAHLKGLTEHVGVNAKDCEHYAMLE